jgi:predicted DNA-binding protein
MTTLNPRINITVPAEIAGILSAKASRQHASLSRIALELISLAIEHDEDVYFSKIAEEVEAKNKKWHSHKAAWK